MINGNKNVQYHKNGYSILLLSHYYDVEVPFYNQFAVRQPTAIKEHTCHHCGRKILPKSRYAILTLRTSPSTNAYYYTMKLHMECFELLTLPGVCVPMKYITRRTPVCFSNCPYEDRDGDCSDLGKTKCFDAHCNHQIYEMFEAEYGKQPTASELTDFINKKKKEELE